MNRNSAKIYTLTLSGAQVRVLWSLLTTQCHPLPNTHAARAAQLVMKQLSVVVSTVRKDEEKP